MTASDSIDLRHWVREVPDFPKPGILFRDLSPLMRSPDGWAEAMRRMAGVCERIGPDMIVGIESRGFIVGMALATQVGLGFVPVRKPGKLPGAVIRVDYSLEYGQDSLEIPADALADGPRVLVVDDLEDQRIIATRMLLATGGTAAATAALVEKAGGEVCGFGFVVELAGLEGRSRLPQSSVIHSLITYH